MQNIGDRIQNISIGFKSPNAWEIVGAGFSIVSQKAKGSLIDKWHILTATKKLPSSLTGLPVMNGSSCMYLNLDKKLLRSVKQADLT